MCDIDYVSIIDVKDPVLLARYIEQRVGTPWATAKDVAILRKKCKEFFEHYPHLTYGALCHAADWAHKKKKRLSHVWKVVDMFRYAYEDGFVPEADRTEIESPIAMAIDEALAVETDDIWRTRLIATDDAKVRKEVLDRWQTTRRPQLLPA